MCNVIHSLIGLSCLICFLFQNFIMKLVSSSIHQRTGFKKHKKFENVTGNEAFCCLKRVTKSSPTHTDACSSSFQQRPDPVCVRQLFRKRLSKQCDGGMRASTTQHFSRLPRLTGLAATLTPNTDRSIPLWVTNLSRSIHQPRHPSPTAKIHFTYT